MRLTLLLCAFLYLTGAYGQRELPQKEPSELARAQAYFEREEYRKALDFLEEILKDSRQPKVYRLAFESYLALQEYDEAEDLAEDFIKADPGRRHLYEVDLFFLYGQTEDGNKEEDLMEEILERIERSPSRAYVYGKTFQDQGYPKLALTVYQKARDIMPQLNLDYQMAQVYGELGELEKMYGMYAVMVEKNPNYLSTVKTLLSRSIQPEDTSAAIASLKEDLISRIQSGGPESLNELLTHIYIQEKNFRGAYLQLRALQRRDKAGPGELMRLARVASNNEDFDLAARIYDHILKEGERGLFYETAKLGKLQSQKAALEAQVSSSPTAWQKLAADYQEALSELAGNPIVAPLTLDLAPIYAYRLGKSDTAKALLQTVLETGFVGREQKARAYVALGDIQLYDGDRWEAILNYKRAEQDLERSEIGQEAKFKRAKAAYYVGDFAWAQNIFQVLKASTSKEIANDAMRYSLLISDNSAMDTSMEAIATFARADLFYYRQRLDSALFLLERMPIGFAEHPILDEVHLLRGDIYYQQQDYQKAQAAWQKVVKEHGDDILADDALYRLANLQAEKLAQPDEAMHLYQKLFTEYVDSFYAAEARKRFRSLRGDSIQ